MDFAVSYWFDGELTMSSNTSNWNNKVVFRVGEIPTSRLLKSDPEPAIKAAKIRTLTSCGKGASLTVGSVKDLDTVKVGIRSRSWQRQRRVTGRACGW